jgi:outer membrane protein OmpA-like peptidoglycan-associated protein
MAAGHPVSQSITARPVGVAAKGSAKCLSQSAVPVASNATAAGRQQNRRVEIVIEGQPAA